MRTLYGCCYSVWRVFAFLAICIVFIESFSKIQHKLLSAGSSRRLSGTENYGTLLFSSPAAEGGVEEKCFPNSVLPDLSSLTDYSSGMGATDSEGPEGAKLSKFGEGDGDEDPYASMLNLDEPLKENAADDLISECSIANNGGKGGTSTISRVAKKVPKWEYWDDFMEEEFGDMDREITSDDDKWILELRDAVELKRGMAIWSKRSDEEVKREMKKYLSEKALKVPDYVTNIIRCVYLEKIATMSEMRVDHELDVINFRKWVLEKRKKTKKDPIPGVKIEVSRHWLFQHPSKFETSRSTEMPSVCMDDKLVPHSTTSVAALGESQQAPMPPTDSTTNSTPGSNSSGSNLGAIVTYSMQNWDNDVKDEMLGAALTAVGASGPDNAKDRLDRFYIDDHEMYLATGGEYYIVM